MLTKKNDIYLVVFKRPQSMILGNIKTCNIKEVASLARKNKCYNEIYMHGLKNLISNLIETK